MIITQTSRGLSSEEWNKDKTRRMNLKDDHRFPHSRCTRCNGSGWIWKDWDAGIWVPCSCQHDINARNNTANAGMTETLSRFKLTEFKTSLVWQTMLLKSTCEYARNPKGFLYICGQSGCGKTHLAAGAFGHILKDGAKGKFCSWPNLTTQLKALQNSSEYGQLLAELKGCPILYLDDFLHAAKNQPTAGEVRLAFGIISARYNAGQLPTIMTSNLLPEEIEKIDSSLAGRIKEAAGSHLLMIRPDPAKDYRSRNAVEV